MAISGNGREYDITFLSGALMRTTTSQYRIVGFAPGTTTNTDRTVDLAGGTSTLAEPTATAAYAIGINQTYMSANAVECNVRMFGISKAICAESITAGMFVLPYGGVGAAASTTTMAGRIVQLDNGITITAYGATISSQCVVLGRALEDGSTGTVISVFVNPQLYDRQLVGTIGTT